MNHFEFCEISHNSYFMENTSERIERIIPLIIGIKKIIIFMNCDAF